MKAMKKHTGIDVKLITKSSVCVSMYSSGAYRAKK